MGREIAGCQHATCEGGEGRRLPWQAILDHTPVTVAVLEPDGTILHVTRAFVASSGYEPGFFSGKKLFALPPYLACEDLVRGVAREGRPCSVRAMPFQHPDFPERPVSYWDWTLVPVISPDGSLQYLVSTAVDVSERVRAESALRSSEEQYRALVEHSLQGIMVVQGPAPRVEARTAALAEAVARLEREAAKRERAEAELARSYRLLSGLNQVASSLSSASDAQAVWNALGSVVRAEGLSIAVFLLDDEGKRLFVHYTGLPFHVLAEYERLTGHPLVGYSFSAEGGPLAGVLAGRQAVFQEAPGALGVLAVALELPPEGVERVLHLFRERPSERAIAVPLIAEGRALGVFVVRGADLREADVPAFELMADQVSHALERLGRARKVAELEILRETDRMRAELIANVSHEIRTPLGMIDVLCTSLLADDVAFDAETQRSFLGGIKEATDRLAAMVGNLLQLSRAEDGRLVLHRRPTDLGKLATAVVERVRVGAPRHQLICSEQEAEHVALVDPEQMEQVLSNLLSNAIKYSPDGGPIVVTLAWQGEELILSVSDQGIGIPEEEQERIFERFYRVDDAIGRKVSGAGLGLAVCRAVVEAHGGKIRVASRLGMGSTFYVSLPTNPASPAVYGR